MFGLFRKKKPEEGYQFKELKLPGWGAKPCGEVCTETSPRPFPCDGLGLFDLCRQHQTGHCSRTRRAGGCESAPDVRRTGSMQYREGYRTCRPRQHSRPR